MGNESGSANERTTTLHAASASREPPAPCPRPTPLTSLPTSYIGFYPTPLIPGWDSLTHGRASTLRPARRGRMRWPGLWRRAPPAAR